MQIYGLLAQIDGFGLGDDWVELWCDFISNLLIIIVLHLI